MDPAKRTFYLGRYNCIEQLGSGPIGDTYRAKIYGVAGFEKQFAVKRLHPQLSGDEAFVARFVQAASAFAALEHHGIAHVHEVNAQGAHYYVVIDLVRGLDLRHLLDLLQQRGEALSSDVAIAVALQIAEALEYAHGRTNVLPGGVLHLGLTAASTMVTYDGEVKLVDVGLLAALIRPGWSDADELTPTLAYVAPEEWRGDGIDARADVFSLAVVLHELMGGSRAFVSDRSAELRCAIEAGPPAPPPGDPRLQEIVTRGLQPDRDRRFANMLEIRHALQAIIGGRLERARADLSAVVRRLAMPRERRTGAFAAVTLPSAASGMSSPVALSSPPPIPAAARAWAPPVPKPPIGAVLSAIPVHNTLAGIGPDDQALVPIELVELPGLPTEKAMPADRGDEVRSATAAADDAETNRVAKVAAAPGTSAPVPPASADLGWAELANDAEAATVSASAAAATPAVATSEPSPSTAAATTNVDAVTTAATGDIEGPTKSASEPSWMPPALEQPPPSPVPAFAAPTVERPAPVERPVASVPGVKLPAPRDGGGRAVLGSVALLAIAGALAIYAGLSGTWRPAPTTPGSAPSSAVTSTAAGTAAAAPPAAAARPAATAPQTATPPPGAAAARTSSGSGPIVLPASALGSNVTAPAPTAPAPAAPAGAAAPPTAANPSPSNPSPATPTPANARTSPAAATAAFEVTTTPPGAALFVDGADPVTSPAKLDVTPGRHKLVVAAEGERLVEREIDATPGGHLDLALEPARLPAGVAGPDGLKVRCKSRGELRIFVDGADSGRSCPNEERISVVAGPHKIGLKSARTGELHEVDHDVVEGNLSTRVYVKY